MLTTLCRSKIRVASGRRPVLSSSFLTSAAAQRSSGVHTNAPSLLALSSTAAGIGRGVLRFFALLSRGVVSTIRTGAGGGRFVGRGVFCAEVSRRVLLWLGRFVGRGVGRGGAASLPLPHCAPAAKSSQTISRGQPIVETLSLYIYNCTDQVMLRESTAVTV